MTDNNTELDTELNPEALDHVSGGADTFERVHTLYNLSDIERMGEPSSTYYKNDPAALEALKQLVRGYKAASDGKITNAIINQFINDAGAINCLIRYPAAVAFVTKYWDML